MIQQAALLFLIITPFAFIDFAQANPKKEWFQCKTDKECADINFSCASAVVNHAYLKEAGSFYKLENSRRNCMPAEPKTAKDGESMPFRVFCNGKGVCDKEGENPKKGFS